MDKQCKTQSVQKQYIIVDLIIVFTNKRVIQITLEFISWYPIWLKI